MSMQQSACYVMAANTGSLVFIDNMTADSSRRMNLIGAGLCFMLQNWRTVPQGANGQ